MTPEKYNLIYNNFYEFSTSKHLDAERAEDAALDGQDRRHGREGADVAIDELIKAMGLEERLYRHRCVEAWSMAIPWTGFPLKKLVDSPSPCPRPNMSVSRPSSTRKWRRASAWFCPGPMSRA